VTVDVVADAAAVLLAHQGGWDETLMVLAPVVLVAALLHRANRRAKQHLARQGRAGDAGPPAGPVDPAGPPVPDPGRD
jgi:hypothetical protein